MRDLQAGSWRDHRPGVNRIQGGGSLRRRKGCRSDTVTGARASTPRSALKSRRLVMISEVGGDDSEAGWLAGEWID
jgi:hypothetical protein